MNKCYSRPCGPEESKSPLDPLLPTALPSKLITLPHPTASLHGILSVPHSEPQRPIKVKALVFDYWFEGRVHLVHEQAYKNRLQLG